ncbi:MAG TPA: septal ring lytic transglycosylase RlpA family protein [Silvibacterium sp.]|nr:septal ring lytic transglycosylase RlpA family protein [Silvibacterium sp.]
MNAIAISKNTRSRRYALIAGAVLLTCVGATSSTGTAEPPVKPVQQQPATAHHWVQTGRASWYGKFFQGQQTASGESFDMNAMTCAHRSLPMGSMVKVTNLRNHRSVVVRVNDRGPVPANRIIDLSYAAARFLGFGQRGTAPVRLELLSDNSQVAKVSFPESGKN